MYEGTVLIFSYCVGLNYSTVLDESMVKRIICLHWLMKRLKNLNRKSIQRNLVTSGCLFGMIWRFKISFI